MAELAPHVLDWIDAFPALKLEVPVDGNPQRLAFLDSAASAQKPECLLESIGAAMEGPYANIHRGLYFNSAQSTEAYERARAVVAAFLGAKPAGVVFTRNATEAVNLVAATWGRSQLKAGDAVLLTELEHHANIVPWQMLRDEKGIEIRVAKLNDAHEITLEEIAKHLADGKVKLLAITQMSNVLGTRPPLDKIIPAAHAAGAKVLVDGSQGAVHMGPQNIEKLGADFYVLSAHKLYGPTGLGVLAASPEMLNSLPPYMGGGDMIESVSFARTTYAEAPARFEAGTPAFIQAIGFAAVLKQLSSWGWNNIAKHEKSMADELENALAEVDGMVRYGPAASGIFSFNLSGLHHHDVATVLNQCGVAVRSGHHCAMPLMDVLGKGTQGFGTVRASVALYTTPDDIAQLVEALAKAKKILG